jgi:hypothetical protein
MRYCADYNCRHHIELGPAEVDRGRIQCGCPIWSPGSSASGAAIAALTSGPTFRRPRWGERLKSALARLDNSE